MSVSFAQAVADGLRHNGVEVHFWDGWDRRGNGQTSAYQGLVVHHTASKLGSAYRGLVTGRPGLSGPLCNSSGNDDGSVTIIAAHPANHAGASGGKAMGPLPTTRTFNKVTWGHEIVYPGTTPMTREQFDAAIWLARVVSGILKRPTIKWVRAHGETSVTGKWDPGFASGKMIDMGEFRRIATTIKVDKDPEPTPVAIKAPTFPLPVGYYFGPKDGPKESISNLADPKPWRREGLRHWQARMRERGWTIDTDGFYGPQTANIARQFQAQKGLFVDGKIGPATWAAAWTVPLN